MSLSLGILRSNASKIRNFSSSRRSFTGGKIIFSNKQAVGRGGSTSSTPPSSPSGEVPGLSSNVVKVPAEPVGPGAAKTSGYKNPEYFCYDQNSYFEAEVEMLKYRCPQPSTKQYYDPTKK